MDLDGVRILLVDASDVARSLVRLALAGEYDVDEACSGADALLALSGRRYACVVIDVALPDMTGHELLSIARRTAGDGMSVVMIADTSDESPDSRRARADAWLHKPLHPKALMDTVRRLVGPSPAVRETPVPGAHALLEALPYPAMVLDAEHRVWLANGSFYDATGRGIDGCFIDCGSAMHGPDGVPSGCPLEESKRTGEPVEREVEIPPLGRLRVSVFPLLWPTPDGMRTFLHITTLVAAVDSDARSEDAVERRSA